MTDATTIKLSSDTKAALDKENLDGETFDETVARLLGETDGKTWTDDEIREIVREEIRSQQQTY
jgi:predicted transcriptional regulator